MTKENEELKKRMSGVEEMIANLIVDQQAMAKAFQERGDWHSGNLERHRTDLNTTQKDIIRLKDNQFSIVDECSVLRTQVESMGDNLCRSGLRKKLLDSFLLIPSYMWGMQSPTRSGRRCGVCRRWFPGIISYSQVRGGECDPGSCDGAHSSACRPVFAFLGPGEHSAQDGDAATVERPRSGRGGDPHKGVLPANPGRA